MNKILKAIPVLIFVFFVGSAIGMKAQTDSLSSKIVRFHIVADSNDDKAQAVKWEIRKAIFDKHFFEKETIMALYATKNAFSVADVFGDYVQKQEKYLFGDFFKEKKADPHFA